MQQKIAINDKFNIKQKATKMVYIKQKSNNIRYNKNNTVGNIINTIMNDKVLVSSSFKKIKSPIANMKKLIVK